MVTNFENKFGSSNNIRADLGVVRECMSYLRSQDSEFDEYISKTPCIIVGGTNGKGSTSSYLATFFTNFGVSCGLYTSPHLVEELERIYIGDSFIDDSEFDDIYSKLKQILGKRFDDLTYFEKMTIFSGYVFFKKNTKINIFEVGMGGVFDATNIFPAETSVITGISLDHTKYLGSTLDEIFEQKAGIIHGRQSFWSDLGGVSTQKKNQIKQRVVSQGCMVYEYGTSWIYREDRGEFSICMDPQEEVIFKVPHSIKDIKVLSKNFALSTVVFRFIIERYGFGIDKSDLDRRIEKILKKDWSNEVRVRVEEKESVSKVVISDEKLRLPPTLFGRYQKIELQFDDGSVKVLRVDVCHNEDGVKNFTIRVKQIGRTEGKPLVALVSIFKDKDYKTVIKMLQGVFDRIYIFQSGSERSVTKEEIFPFLTGDGSTKFYTSFDLLWKDCKDIYYDFWVCGSVYGVGEILKYFKIYPRRIYDRR